MTHFIYPEIPGFEQAGGADGAEGRLQRTPRGRHGGRREVHEARRLPERQVHRLRRRCRSSARPATRTPRTRKSSTRRCRTSASRRSSTWSTSRSCTAKYCGVPAEEIDVCPNVGWVADFGDPQAVLDVTFNGKNISPSGNDNWGQVERPARSTRRWKPPSWCVGTRRARTRGRRSTETGRPGRGDPVRLGQAAEHRVQDVAGVGDLWNTGAWDYGFTSLK